MGVLQKTGTKCLSSGGKSTEGLNLKIHWALNTNLFIGQEISYVIKTLMCKLSCCCSETWESISWFSTLCSQIYRHCQWFRYLFRFRLSLS